MGKFSKWRAQRVSIWLLCGNRVKNVDKILIDLPRCDREQTEFYSTARVSCRIQTYRLNYCRRWKVRLKKRRKIIESDYAKGWPLTERSIMVRTTHANRFNAFANTYCPNLWCTFDGDEGWKRGGVIRLQNRETKMYALKKKNTRIFTILKTYVSCRDKIVIYERVTNWSHGTGIFSMMVLN